MTDRPDLEPQNGRGPRCPQCGSGNVHPHPDARSGRWVEMHCTRCGSMFLTPDSEVY